MIRVEHVFNLWMNLLLILTVLFSHCHLGDSFFITHPAFCRRLQQQSTINTKSPRARNSYLIVLHGNVLSKSAILRGKKNDKRNPFPSAANSFSILLEAIDEAILRQELILKSLNTNELEKSNSSWKSKATILARKREVEMKVDKLNALKKHKNNSSSNNNNNINNKEVKQIQKEMIDLGFESILRQSPSSWKTRKKIQSEAGRPTGFDGLVFYSPKGVPILIGKQKAHKDETLRRVSQGADLWFQVQDYNGSRVLLRTSLKPGLRNSKECMQMAADLAARYSDWWDSLDVQEGNIKVPVMYTDSKHVAKRGSKVGQMRQRKCLGKMVGYPKNVQAITIGKDNI